MDIWLHSVTLYFPVGYNGYAPGGTGGGGVMFAPQMAPPPALPAEAMIPQMQSTPTRQHTQAVFGDSSHMSQPTTPIAGGGLIPGQIMSMPGTPNPIMVSTPNVSPGKG